MRFETMDRTKGKDTHLAGTTQLTLTTLVYTPDPSIPLLADSVDYPDWQVARFFGFPV